MYFVLAQALSIFSQIITFLVLAHVILSYFMIPNHPIRSFVDKLVDPLLAPIRRVIPTVAMMDFSPVILIILVQFIDSILQYILLRL